MKSRFISCLLVIFTLVYSYAQIKRVEPPNWWVGMKNTSLQLLVYGNNIGETTPVLNYPGVSLKKYTMGDSKNYLFLDLDISTNVNAGNIPIKFKKGNKIIYTHSYPIKERKSKSEPFIGFNSSDAIYLIVPDRFANGNVNNDAVKELKETKVDRKFEGGRHGGDIRGIIDHLDYIADMGYTAIWSTPLLENNMERYSYHGYSITDHYKVDPRFGTIDDYIELAQKAKSKGIKLIFDDVVNHIGLNYWWMKDMPFNNWINYPTTHTNTNHRRTINQDKYASEYDKKLMSQGWFVDSMPDMNQENSFMANYLIQCSLWWIETLQLGGIRQDTYPYSNKNFLSQWSCRIMDEYPNFNIVGEEWSINPLVTSYWQTEKQRADNYVSCLKSVMDFPLHSALIQALNEPDGWGLGDKLNLLYEALANDFNYADPNNILVMPDNHDMDRVFTQLNNDVALTKMAIAYYLTIRGIPQFLYGDEILMENSTSRNNHGVIRSDFPGGWPDDLVSGFTGNGLTEEQKSFQEYFKKLLNWRKANPVIANGNTMHFAPFDGVYVYFRYNSKKTIMVVMNKRNTDYEMNTERFNEIASTFKSAVNVLSNEEILIKTIKVSAKSTTIFELK